MAMRREQKGSLSLRCNHMDYGRATLVSNWHEAREAEPKDNDIHRNLHQSTYNRILNVTDGSLPISTCRDHMNTINQRRDFEERTSRHLMIDQVNFLESTKARDTGAPGKGFGSILPRHPENHNVSIDHVESSIVASYVLASRYNSTTYLTDYRTTSLLKEAKPQLELHEKNNSPAYKKCHSQFTDVADYRRHGRNTWMNESAVYANRDIKNDVFTSCNPIAERLL